MALGYLKIFYIIILLAAVVLQFFLYWGIKGRKKLVLILNGLYGIILGGLAFTAQPTNYIFRRILATLGGIMAIYGLFLGLRKRDKIFMGKLLISLAIGAGLIQLLI